MPTWIYWKATFGDFFFCLSCVLTAMYQDSSAKSVSTLLLKAACLLYVYGTQEKLLENNRNGRKEGTYRNAHLRWSSQICTCPCSNIDPLFPGSLLALGKVLEGRTERLSHKLCSKWWALWKASRKGCTTLDVKRQVEQVTWSKVMLSVPPWGPESRWRMLRRSLRRRKRRI